VLAEVPGVGGEDIRFWAVGQKPGCAVDLVPTGERVDVGGQPWRAEAEGAEEQHIAVGALQCGNCRGVVAVRIVPPGVVGGDAPPRIGDAQRRFRQPSPPARTPRVVTVPVEQRIAHVVQYRRPASGEKQPALDRLQRAGALQLQSEGATG